MLVRVSADASRTYATPIGAINSPNCSSSWWAPMPAAVPCCSSDPVELLLGTRSTQGPAERLDIAGAR
ncbi:MAG: hypothetical protein K8R24_00565, partial [Mycobacterium sp.]|nr:hypothetical protein [Mycobacterium sp.]